MVSFYTFAMKNLVSKLEQENKELKEELDRRIKIKNSIDVDYKIIE